MKGRPEKGPRARKVRWHGTSAPGTPPGTLTQVEGAPSPRVTFVRYTPTEVEEGEIQDPSRIADLQARGGVLWVDVCGHGAVEVVEAIGNAFSLHPLALEDVLKPQRTKVEKYPSHLFLVARRARVGEPGLTEQVSLFLGEGFVTTFREVPSDWLDVVKKRIRNPQSRTRASRADYLAYVVLDTIVDHSLPVVEIFGDHLDALEFDLLEGSAQDVAPQIQSARQGLLHLRRALWPLREALAQVRGDPDLVHEDTLLYLRDCTDHVVRTLELIDSYRELAADLMSLHQAALSTRMNEVMKTLTIIATIFIPLSFIAGLYGMNFDPEKSPLNMPELGWYWGYPFALSTMGVVSAVLLFYFWKKGWLGKRG